MKTRTTIEAPSSDINISHNDQIITIGSCFADRIGTKLNTLKYRGSFNPFGILYNPISILQTIQSFVLNRYPNPEHYSLLQGSYVHYDYHSDLSAGSALDLKELISDKQKVCAEELKTAHTIIITIGTAYVFEYIKTGNIIANCHKQAADQFRRRLLH